ncbi:MAG: peptidylprolyl isomerase [Alphaproteobacteria bacterium]|jgi:peptidylprolyl isomerase
MPVLKKMILALCALAISVPLGAANAQKTNAEVLAEINKNTLVIELSTGGKVELQLFPKRAPKHVERVKTLVAQKFYDGIVFHRVIPGFMAQTGDPDGNGQGGSKLPDLPAEFNEYVFKRGTVGAARTNDPNSANSQFFICYNNNGCSHLTGQYTVWGQVLRGMVHIDKVAGPKDKMTKVYLKSNPR